MKQSKLSDVEIDALADQGLRDAKFLEQAHKMAALMGATELPLNSKLGQAFVRDLREKLERDLRAKLEPPPSEDRPGRA